MNEPTFNPTDPKNVAYVPAFLLWRSPIGFIAINRFPCPDVEAMRARREMRIGEAIDLPEADREKIAAAEAKRARRAIRRAVA